MTRPNKVLDAMIYFFAGVITAVGGTDLFIGRQAKIIVFCLGITILALGAIKIAIANGKPKENVFIEKAETENNGLT